MYVCMYVCLYIYNIMYLPIMVESGKASVDYRSWLEKDSRGIGIHQNRQPHDIALQKLA